jgi:hypothetical protein
MQPDTQTTDQADVTYDYMNQIPHDLYLEGEAEDYVQPIGLGETNAYETSTPADASLETFMNLRTSADIFFFVALSKTDFIKVLILPILDNYFMHRS